MFHEQRFLDCVKFGASGGPTFNTSVVAVLSGSESRNGNWSRTRHRYEIGMAARLQSEFMAIKTTYLLCMGRLYGFRWKDAADYQASTSEGTLQGLLSGAAVGAQGYGYGVPVYQLHKLYTLASLAFYRRILKPVAGTITVRRNGSPVTVGVSAGNVAIDTTTGQITFVADAFRNVSSVTVGGTTQIVVASSALSEVGIGDRLYLSGLAGADADLLNGKAHLVSGLTSTTYTLTTNTAGKTITTGSGLASAFPQADETLTASFDFDVPVRFDTDEFSGVIVDRNGAGGELIIELPSISLVELKDAE